MPTNYPGDRTATQAPSGPPRAGLPPVASLPVDGDADSAASVAQAFKVAMDYVAFLQNPAANSTAYDQDIWAGAEDASLNGRWGIDHWGFPRASQIDWTQTWAPAGHFSGSAVTDPNWTGTFNGSGSQVVSVAPGILYPVPPLPAGMSAVTSPDQFRVLATMLDSGGSGKASVNLASDSATSCFADDTLAIMDVYAQPFTVLSTNWIIGFGTAEGIDAFQNAVFFRPTPGLGVGAKWQTATMSGGVATAADTAISYNTTGHWFRIIWVGKNLDDGDVAARALFYIDGVRVANVTTNLPNNNQKPILPTIGGYTSEAVATPVLVTGPLRYRQITAVSTAVT